METVKKKVKITKDFLKSFSILIDILSKKEMIGPYKSKFVAQMTKIYPSTSEVTNHVFSNAEVMTSNNPERIIELGRGAIKRFDNITQLASNYTANKKSARCHLRLIKAYWESYEFISPLADLITQSKVPLTSNGSVFKHLIKHFGFSKSDLETIRLIRNCDAHPFKIKNGSIVIFENTKQEISKEISLEQLEVVHDRLEEMYEWWMNAFVNLLWSQPKFGLLVSIGAVSEGKDGGFDEMKEKFETLVQMNPDLEAKKQKREKKKINISKGKSNLPSDSDIDNLKKSEYLDFSKSQMSILLKLLSIQLKSLINYLQDILSLVSPQSREPITKLLDFLESLNNIENENFKKESAELITKGGEILIKAKKLSKTLS